MHPVAKMVTGLGTVIVILCGVLFAFGVIDVSEKAGDVNYVISGQNGGDVQVYDDDNFGDWGFTIFVEGAYEDLDGNGMWDVCDSVNITAIHDGMVMENYGTNESYAVNASDENRFYFEVDSENSECNVGSGETRTVDGKDLVKIGRACWGCMSGTLTIESNEPIWVVNDDEEIAELIGGMFAAMSSACLFPCGCCILIVGIIMGFTLKDDSTAPAVTVSTSVSVMGEEITEQAIPMPDDDSDPAHAYYGGMIARGFDPELAEKMTKEHYPGFNE